jgi:hypothetical protein
MERGTTTPPDRTAPHRRSRPGPVARRVGYLISIALNVVILWLVFVSPGWEAVPFLTDRTIDVLPVVTASILVNIVVNLVWLAVDPLWLHALGDGVNAAMGVVVTGGLLSVFPFSFDDNQPWEVFVRIILVVGLVGASIAVVVNLVMVIRYLTHAVPQD